jgi:hypothetical protein
MWLTTRADHERQNRHETLTVQNRIEQVGIYSTAGREQAPGGLLGASTGGSTSFSSPPRSDAASRIPHSAVR